MIVSVLGLSLVSCAYMKKSDTRLTEDHLTTAGFKIMIADTGEKQKMLKSLPPETITRMQRDDSVYYVYPDPDVCSCLYIGREAEYQRLKELAVDQRISDRQMIANELNEDARLGWGSTGPWGNWGVMGQGYMGRPDWNPD